MSNFNKVILMGNLTRDPQLSYTPSQTAIVDFGMAINRNWKSRTGEDKSEVCFVDCQAFGGTAETLNKYLHKGDPIFIEGRLVFDSWTAQDGTKRSKHKVTIERFNFIGSRSVTSEPQSEATERKYPGGKVSGQNPDDDIPF